MIPNLERASAKLISLTSLVGSFTATPNESKIAGLPFLCIVAGKIKSALTIESPAVYSIFSHTGGSEKYFKGYTGNAGNNWVTKAVVLKKLLI